MKHLLLLLLYLSLCQAAKAQGESAVKVSEGGYGLVRTNLSVEYEHSWGQVSDEFEARASYEFLKKRHLTLSANARYNSYTTDFDEVSFSDGFEPSAIGLNKTHIMGHAVLTATARGKLFGRPVMGLALVNTGFSPAGFDRVSGILMGLVMLRANRDTQFGLGPLVMLNTTSRIPAFLVFVYRHRFNDKWLLNLYGAMFGVEYTPTANDLLAAGADVNVKSFFFKTHDDRLPGSCRFTLTTARPLIKYRRRLGDNLYFEAKGGVALRMSCRINGRTGTHTYSEGSQKPAPFIRIGLSYAM